YSFQGQEHDDEVKGKGNSISYQARIYDPRIGRWLSVDPYSSAHKGYSPYNFALNSPLVLVDPTGGIVVFPKGIGSKKRRFFKRQIKFRMKHDPEFREAHLSRVNSTDVYVYHFDGKKDSHSYPETQWNNPTIEWVETRQAVDNYNRRYSKTLQRRDRALYQNLRKAERQRSRAKGKSLSERETRSEAVKDAQRAINEKDNDLETTVALLYLPTDYVEFDKNPTVILKPDEYTKGEFNHPYSVVPTKGKMTIHINAKQVKDKVEIRNDATGEIIWSSTSITPDGMINGEHDVEINYDLGDGNHSITVEINSEGALDGTELNYKLSIETPKEDDIMQTGDGRAEREVKKGRVPTFLR
ncbi:MAG: hypothetical protein HWE22_09785, partial [Flavobacteriales bacterium]|nr:hypothetical protein [Flavobacteriales bacterium]